MQTKHLFLLPALAFLACTGLQAQVTFGGLTEPAAGAVLDLNSTAKGGLLLSNVSIADLSKIPTGTNLFPGIIAGNNDNTNTAFKGAMVYHIGTPDIPAGIYIWNGVRWIPPGGCDCPAGTVADDECNCYSINKFGDAGIWMTQNLRTTVKDYGNDIFLQEFRNGIALITTPHYTYPRVPGYWSDFSNENDKDSVFRAHPEYGLLYNWVAASGRIGDDSDDSAGGGQPGYGDNPPTEGVYHQGICPDGWHLPSDYEWSELEQEIATNPGSYSIQDAQYEDLADYNFFDGTAWNWRPNNGGNGSIVRDKYWGRQMKSQTPVDAPSYGSSMKREEGGFDALLVGDVNNIGTAQGYGVYIGFWVDSSHGANGMDRGLNRNNTGVYRFQGYSKSQLFSIRCKKN
jgi:uncharacterized protein (TIGR02145 family)